MNAQLQTSAEVLASKEQQIEQYKAIAVSSEEALAELTRAHDAFKESTQQRIDEQEGQLQGLRQRERDLVASLEKLTTETKEHREALEASITGLTNEKQELAAKVEKLEKFETTVDSFFFFVGFPFRPGIRILTFDSLKFSLQRGKVRSKKRSAGSPPSMTSHVTSTKDRWCSTPAMCSC